MSTLGEFCKHARIGDQAQLGQKQLRRFENVSQYRQGHHRFTMELLLGQRVTPANVIVISSLGSVLNRIVLCLDDTNTLGQQCC